MKTLKTVAASTALFLGMSVGFLARANAEGYPNRPIKLICGFAAGGPSDNIARSLAKALGDELKQPVVVENRAGAAGVVGMDALTNSQPDGYTVGLVANTTTTALHFQGKKLDIDHRFIPVGRFVSTRILLLVNPEKMNVKSLPEFVNYLRQHPGTSLTSAGHGGIGHLTLELFALDQKLKITHVAYRGTAPAMQDVIAGIVPAMVSDATTAMPQVTAGRLRPIAVVSTSRIPSLPALPTAVEMGYKDLAISSSMGLVVPPKTPVAIVDRLRVALRKAVDSPSYIQAASAQGNERYFEDSAQFKVWLQKDFDRYGEIIREANVKVE